MTEEEIIARSINHEPVYVVKSVGGEYKPFMVFIKDFVLRDGCSTGFSYYNLGANLYGSGHSYIFYPDMKSADDAARKLKEKCDNVLSQKRECEKFLSESAKNEESKAKDRGYFGIGVFHGKNSANIGTLWRSAAILDADFIFTIGKRYQKQASDTMKTYRHIPLYHYEDYEDFLKHVPYGCPVIAVELDESAVPVEDFKHPERCIYLLGAEDGCIPKNIINRCQGTVQLMGDYCYNVAVAGSLVMYDRKRKEKK